MAPTTSLFTRPSETTHIHFQFFPKKQIMDHRLNKILIKSFSSMATAMQQTVCMLENYREQDGYKKRKFNPFGHDSDFLESLSMYSDHDLGDVRSDHFFAFDANVANGLPNDDGTVRSRTVPPPLSPLGINSGIYASGFSSFSKLTPQSSDTTQHPRSPTRVHESQFAIMATEDGGDGVESTIVTELDNGDEVKEDADVSDSDWEPVTRKKGKSLIVIVQSNNLVNEQDWGSFAHLISLIPISQETDFSQVHQVLSTLNFGCDDYPTVLSFMDSLRSLVYEEDMVELIQNEVWTVITQCWVLDEMMSGSPGFNTTSIFHRGSAES